MIFSPKLSIVPMYGSISFIPNQLTSTILAILMTPIEGSWNIILNHLTLIQVNTDPGL